MRTPSASRRAVGSWPPSLPARSDPLKIDGADPCLAPVAEADAAPLVALLEEADLDAGREAVFEGGLIDGLTGAVVGGGVGGDDHGVHEARVEDLGGHDGGGEYGPQAEETGADADGPVGAREAGEQDGPAGDPREGERREQRAAREIAGPLESALAERRGDRCGRTHLLAGGVEAGADALVRGVVSLAASEGGDGAPGVAADEAGVADVDVELRVPDAVVVGEGAVARNRLSEQGLGRGPVLGGEGVAELRVGFGEELRGGWGRGIGVRPRGHEGDRESREHEREEFHVTPPHDSRSSSVCRSATRPAASSRRAGAGSGSLP